MDFIRKPRRWRQIIRQRIFNKKQKKMSNKNNYLDAMAILKDIGQLHDFVIDRNGGPVTKDFPTARYHELMGELSMLMGEIFSKDKKVDAGFREERPDNLRPNDQSIPKPIPQIGLQEGLYSPGQQAEQEDRDKLVLFDRPLAEKLMMIAEVAMAAVANSEQQITELQTPNEPIGLTEIRATIDDARIEMEKLSVSTGDGKPGAIANVQLLTRLMDIASGVTMLPATTESQATYKTFANNIIGVAKKALMYTSAGLGMRVPE
jgi:hypothetical protein